MKHAMESVDFAVEEVMQEKERFTFLFYITLVQVRSG
jgi:hypothetical protein